MGLGILQLRSGSLLCTEWWLCQKVLQLLGAALRACRLRGCLTGTLNFCSGLDGPSPGQGHGLLLGRQCLPGVRGVSKEDKRLVRGCWLLLLQDWSRMVRVVSLVGRGSRDSCPAKDFHSSCVSSACSKAGLSGSPAVSKGSKGTVGA